MLSVVVFVGALAAAWYVLIIRPQRAQQGVHATLLGQLRVGDHVMTIGGIFGRVEEISGETVLLRTGAQATTRVAVDGIARTVQGDFGDFDASLEPAAVQQPQAGQQVQPAAAPVPVQPVPLQQQAPPGAAAGYPVAVPGPKKIVIEPYRSQWYTPPKYTPPASFATRFAARSRVERPPQYGAPPGTAGTATDGHAPIALNYGDLGTMRDRGNAADTATQTAQNVIEPATTLAPHVEMPRHFVEAISTIDDVRSELARAREERGELVERFAHRSTPLVRVDQPVALAHAEPAVPMSSAAQQSAMEPSIRFGEMGSRRGAASGLFVHPPIAPQYARPALAAESGTAFADRTDSAPQIIFPQLPSLPDVPRLRGA